MAWEERMCTIEGNGESEIKQKFPTPASLVNGIKTDVAAAYWSIRKKVNSLEWILGCSNYCQETWKQKTKINQQTIIINNRKLKNYRKLKPVGNIIPTMDYYLGNG